MCRTWSGCVSRVRARPAYRMGWLLANDPSRIGRNRTEAGRFQQVEASLTSRRKRLLIVFLTIVAAAFVASACGGALSKREYVTRVDAIGGKVEGALSALEPASETSQPPSAAELTAVADAMQSAAGQLRAIDPPKEVATPHRKLITGLTSMARGLRSIATRLDAATSDAARTRLFLTWKRDASVRSGLEDIRQAQEEFDRRSYPLFTSDEPATGAR